MALFNFGTSDGSTRNTQQTQLGELTPGGGGLRDTSIGTGMGQSNLFSALLQREYGNMFGGAGAPAPGTTPFANIAPKIGQGILGSQEFGNRLAGGDLGSIIAGAYRSGLGREATGQEIGNWMQTGQGPQDIFQGILGSEEAGKNLGGMNAQQGVEAMYQALLGRAPTPDELSAWYQQSGLPAQGAGGAQADPNQGMYDLARTGIEGQLSGRDPILPPAVQAQLDQLFGYQRDKGLRNLDQQFRTSAQDRGLDAGLGTTVGNMRALAEGEFLGNLGSQQAGAGLAYGQQQMNNRFNVLNFQTNQQALADRNRQLLLTGNPGAAAALNNLLSNERVAGAGRTTNTNTSNTGVGTNASLGDIQGIGQGLVGAGTQLLPLFKDWFGSGGGSNFLSGGDMFMGGASSGFMPGITDPGFTF